MAVSWLLQMPVKNFDPLDFDRRRKAVEYVPGYDWIPGKFGPPPGIAKARKDEFGWCLLSILLCIATILYFKIAVSDVLFVLKWFV